MRAAGSPVPSHPRADRGMRELPSTSLKIPCKTLAAPIPPPTRTPADPPNAHSFPLQEGGGARLGLRSRGGSGAEPGADPPLPSRSAPTAPPGARSAPRSAGGAAPTSVRGTEGAPVRGSRRRAERGRGDPERHRAIRTFGKDLRDQRDAPSVRASPRRGKRGRQRRVGELCLRMAMGQQSPKPRIPPRTAGGAEAVLTEHTICTSPLSPSPAIGVPRRTRSIITPRASPPTEPHPRCQLSGAPVAILKPGMDKTILTRQMSSG